MEENIVTSLQDTMDVEGQDENQKSSASKNPMNGAQAAALERRLRQELEEQGILNVEENSVAEVIESIVFYRSNIMKLSSVCLG